VLADAWRGSSDVQEVYSRPGFMPARQTIPGASLVGVLAPIGHPNYALIIVSVDNLFQRF
jgi:hypothetical protein